MKPHHFIVSCIALMLCGLPPAARSQADTSNTPLGTLRVKDLTMRELAELLTRGCELPVVVSAACADVPVQVYLQNVNAMDALKTICRSQGLWMTVSSEGVVMITTLEQHLASETVYSDDYMESITVKYPSVNDVADTLKGLFRDRIVWERIDAYETDPIEDIELALSRMEQLSERSQLDIGDAGNSSSRYGSSSSSRYGSSRSSSSRYSSSSRSGSSRSGSSQYDEGEDLGQIEALLERDEFMRDMLEHSMAIGADRPQGISLIYLSALPEINTLLVRSSDRNAVQLVKEAVEAMDKPRGQVLLQVNVLSVTLDDSVETGVEWLFEDDVDDGIASGGFADSAINSLIDPIASTATNLILNPEYVSGTPVASYIHNNVRARVSALAKKENVDELASPTLLVADNEAANVFVGAESKFLDETTTIPIYDKETGTPTSSETTYTLEDRNIGFSLLITPRVHADRSVTLRIMQERSEIDPVLRTIDVGGDASVNVQDIDQQVVTSTLVANDNSLVILGGLITETKVQVDSGIPFLKDLPFIGRFFSFKSDQTVREELMVLIRPHVLAAPGEGEAASRELLERLKIELEELNTAPASEGSVPSDDSSSAPVISGSYPVKLENLLEQMSITGAK